MSVDLIMPIMVRYRFCRCLLVVVWLTSFLLLSACASDTNVPVQEGWHQPLKVSMLYKVQPGDSLYAIAFRYGVDFRKIVQVNHLKSPYHLHTGQVLMLVPERASNTKSVINNTATSVPTSANVVSNAHVTTATPATTTSVSSPAIVTASASNNTHVAPIRNSGVQWVWPAKGNVVDHFTENGLDKGIAIINNRGTPIVAAAAGRVVYAGSGLPGYGQLLIIKHNDNFLSAYAHNAKLLVHEGQLVKSGQPIAEMGDSDAKQVMLHFEIRKNGKPEDPLKYLPQQSSR